MFEESDAEDEPQAEEELSALAPDGLRDMQVALKKIKANMQGQSFGLEDRLNVLSTVLGVSIESRSLNDLPADQFDLGRQPRHAGYNAWTRLVFSRLAVLILLDSGASTNAARHVGRSRHGDHRGDPAGLYQGRVDPAVRKVSHRQDL